MPVEKNLLNATNLIKGIVAIAAFFPGIAVYLKLIEVPPDLVGVAQIVSFSVSIMVLICIPLFSDRICAISRRSIGILAFGALFLGIVSLMGYLQFAKTHVVSVEEEGGVKKYIIPISPSREMLSIVAPMEGRYRVERYKSALEVARRRDELRDRLGSESWDSFVVMVVLLLLSQVLLVTPPVAMAWRLTSCPPTDAVRPNSAPPPEQP